MVILVKPKLINLFKMEKYPSKKVREYHKFHNVMTFRFKKFSKFELKFLALEILDLVKVKNIHMKSEIMPYLINEIYSVILFKNDNPKMFWKMANYLSNFIQVER